MSASRVLLLFSLFVSTSCSGSNSSTAPSIAQLGGVWRGTLTTTSITGGECLASILPPAIGFSQISAAVTQTDSNVSVTTTDLSSGDSEKYSGTVGQSSAVLTWSSCTACSAVGLLCSNGAHRDLVKQSGTINATLNGSTLTGVDNEIYNVLVTGTQTSVGVLTTSGTFTVTRQ